VNAAPPYNAVLVAGGHGRRAGGPKALKIRDGQLMWQWQVRAMVAAGCSQIAAVLHPAAVAAAPPTPPAALGFFNLFIVTADPDAEMLASLQRGLAALSGAVEKPAFMLPVDCPCPSPDVFAALVERAERLNSRGKSWSVIRPWVDYEGRRRRGHPVLLGPALIDLVRAADPATGRLDRLISALPAAARADVAVTDKAICANLNHYW